MNDLDHIDKRLLELLQNDFPLDKRPWMKIGRMLKLEESEVITRLKRLIDQGIIRKIRPILDVKRAGFTSSTLIGLRVEENRIQKVAKIINEYYNVTHNYQRDHEFNLWFTISASNEEELSKTLHEIKSRARVKDGDILNLPTMRLFKINVQFNLR